MIQQSQDQSLGENYSRTEAKKQRTDGDMTSIARRYSRGEATVATRNSEVQRAGSSMVARTQGTYKEMVAGSLPQSHEEVGKREVAVIPQNLLVDQIYKRHCSDRSIKAKKPMLNKSIYSGEYLQPLAQSRRQKGLAIRTEVDDVKNDTGEPLASKEPSHVCIDVEKKLQNPTLSSHTCGEDRLSLQNKETLQSGDERQQSATIKGSAPVRSNIVIQTQEMLPALSGEENLNLERNEPAPSENQQVELQANKQTPGVNDNDGEEIAVDQNQAVASESGNVLTHQPVEFEGNKQTPSVNENDVGEIPVDQNQDVASESLNVGGSEHQQVEIKESSKQTPCVNENAVGEIPVVQSQAVASESFNVVASEHQQVEPEESSKKTPGVNESDVGEIVVVQWKAVASQGVTVVTVEHQQLEKKANNQSFGVNKSGSGKIVVHQGEAVASGSVNVVNCEHQQVEIESDNAEDGIVLGQRQGQDVCSSKEIGQAGRISKIRATFLNNIEQIEANTSSKIVTTIETANSLKVADFSQGQLVGLYKESGQVHDTPMSRSLLHENRRIQADKSTQTAVMTDVGIDAVRDSEPATCSNYARTSGLKHRKTEMWKKFKFSIRHLKGHTDFVCGVDCRNSVLASGGRDTMLKLWDADTGREMRSMGGHTGTITSVFLVPNMEMSAGAVPSSFRTDQYSVLTGSKDCSMKIWSLANGQIKRSMYAFSPVECLDCNNDNLIAAGLDGGKVELWDMESGTAVRSVRGHDENAVTAVKFQDNRVISGSATGVVKVWDIRENSLKPVMSSDQAPTDNTARNVTIKPRRVRCLATTQEKVYWGDDGVNIKAMDLTSGKIRKIRNHLTDFGCTGAMATSGSCLVSAGYDLDRGNGYLNVRSLPSEEYLATVDDECTGTITCLSCTQTTRDKVTVQRMCTGGLELKLWDQLPSSKVRKRSRPETDDVYVSTKHLRRYSVPDISDTESSEDDDDQPEGEDSDDDDDVSNTGNASRSWCTIS